jgi:hypothetical protein
MTAWSSNLDVIDAARLGRGGNGAVVVALMVMIVAIALFLMRSPDHLVVQEDLAGISGP